MNGARETDLRLGLIGCGRLAERGYLPAADRADGVRIVSVADPDRARRRRLAPSLPGFDTAAELVAAGGVDALVLATPAEAHLEDAQIAAAADLPALVEKPPAADAAEAASLARLEPLPAIGFNRRFEPALQDLVAALRGAGTLELRLEHRGRRSSWDPYVVRDDALLTLGPHLLDLVLWLTDSRVERVRARVLEPHKAVLDLELANGRATIRCRLDRPHRERVEARRPDGTVLARRKVGGLVRYALARFGPPHQSPLVATLTQQLEAFAKALRGDHDPRLGTAATGVAVMAAIDAARRSGRSGGSWEQVRSGAGVSEDLPKLTADAHRGGVTHAGEVAP